MLTAVKFSAMGIWMLTSSLGLQMFIIVNKIVKARKPSKDPELGQVKRILTCSYRQMGNAGLYH